MIKKDLELQNRKKNFEMGKNRGISTITNIILSFLWVSEITFDDWSKNYNPIWGVPNTCRENSFKKLFKKWEGKGN